MKSPESPFLTDLEARGSLAACTDLDGLDAALVRGPCVAYVGFDATAPALHVGHLLPMLALRRFAAAGHRPLVLLGGGTSKVGDPSFKDTTRPLLDQDTLAANVAGIRACLERVVGSDAEFVDNADWIEPLRFVEFLRTVGTHFTVSRMLAMEGVRSRLEREGSLTLLEFNYSVLQAFDFLELSRTRGCVLQMGGSDQWGNVVAGIELARRMDSRPLFGLTTPLLTTASGRKMGKTEDGAVWLDPSMTGPYAFRQWWRDVEDDDVRRFLRLFTDVPVAEVDELCSAGGEALNRAKERLADEVTGLVHGAVVADEAPVVVIPAADVTGPLGLAELVVRAGLCSGKGEARRLASGGGVRLDGRKAQVDETVSPEVLRSGVRVTAGRKRHVDVRLAS